MTVIIITTLTKKPFADLQLCARLWTRQPITLAFWFCKRLSRGIAFLMTTPPRQPSLSVRRTMVGPNTGAIYGMKNSLPKTMFKQLWALCCRYPWPAEASPARCSSCKDVFCVGFGFQLGNAKPESESKNEFSQAHPVTSQAGVPADIPTARLNSMLRQALNTNTAPTSGGHWLKLMSIIYETQYGLQMLFWKKKKIGGGEGERA